MEKKYYFRGLGLGIIVTAIIMGIALSGGTKRREMTDDEIIARAKELGMIEDTRLLDPSEREDSEEESEGENVVGAAEPVKKDVAVRTEADAAAEKEDGAEGDAPLGTDTTEPAQTITSAASSEIKPQTDTNEMRKQDDDVSPADAETEEEEENEGDPETAETVQDSDRNSIPAGTKSVTIVSGDGSYTVAQKLEQAGVVSSASSYDTYLCERGYDKKLRTGTFQIPAGATDEQVARIVTGQQ